jgi:phage-related protein
MAGAVELATAYIALVPSLRGASQKISAELNPAAASSGASAGDHMGRSLIGTAAKWAAPLAAAVGFGAALKTGFDEAKDAAAGTAQLAAGIQSTGNAAKVSVSGLNDLASSIQGYSGQTDDSIVKSEQLLLTFTNIKNNGPDKIFDQATKASADMAAKFGGDASQQAVLLGKALNDPVKGISALQRVGVSFTASQKDTIAALVKTGDVAGAQKVILKELNTEFGGAAKAAGQSFPGQLQRVHRAFEDLTQGVVQGFLPVMGPALEGVIKVLQKVGPAAAEMGQKVADKLGAVGGAVKAVFSLFKTGDFNGGIRKALGLEEDSPIIGAIIRIRDAAHILAAGFKMPLDVAASFGTKLNPILQVGVRIRQFVGAVVQDMKILWAGFTMPPEVAASFGAKLNPLLAVGAKIRSAFNSVGPVLGSLFHSVASAVGPLIPQLVQLWGSLSPVQTIFKSIQPLLPQLLGAFRQLATVIGGTLGQALHALLPVFLQLQSVFVRVFQQVLSTVLPVVVRLITMLGQTFTQLIPVIIPIVTRIAQLAATLVAQLAPILMRLISAVMPMVITIFGAVAAAIGPLIETIAGLLIPIIQALMPVVVTVFGVIATVITAAMQIVQGIIMVVTGIITGNWSQVWNGILTILSGVWNLITSLISGAIGIVGSVIGAGLGLVSSVFSSVWNGVVGFLGGVWNNIVNGVSGMIGNVIGFFGGLIGKITGAIGNAGSALFGVGQDIINGLINGIGSMMGAIGNAIVSLVPGPIVGVFKNLLGIASPSKVFKAFGGFIGEGLVIGLTGSVPSIRSATSKMAKEVIAAFDHHGITKGMENSLLSSISRTNDSLVRLANQRGGVLARLKNATTAFNDAVKVRNDYATSVRDSATSGVDASQSMNLAGSLTMQISKTKELTSTLASLKKMGLDSATYKQLADGGLDSIPAAEALLRTGKGGIARVVALQKQLGSAAKGLGNTAAENLYGAGVNAAHGLVNGLKSQSAAIGAQMTAIAKSMSSAIKHALGIRSPSTVFHGFGVNIVEGLMNGTDSLADDLNAKMNNLVKVPQPKVGISPSLRGTDSASARAGVTIGTVHVRDEHEMARLITRKQQDAQAVYGF